MNFLSGYKSYILAALGVVYAVSAYLTGHMDQMTMVSAVWASCSVAALRHGMTE